MAIRIFTIFILFFNILLAAPQNELSYEKEKNEVIALKKELNDFYKKKEDEYLKNKKELETLLQKVTTEKQEIKDLYEKNQIILKDIEGQVASKTAKVYNKMKPKVAAAIFNQMIEEGKVDDVFDIILKLKEGKVTSLMKFLNVGHAALITEKLKNYKSK